MKKILSLLMIAAMLVSGFAVAASAANDSPSGEVTFVSYGDAVVVDKDGNTVEVALPEKPVSVDTTEETPIKEEEVTEKLGDDYKDFKFYGAFEIELTPEAKEVVGEGSIKETTVTVSVAGIDASNTPAIVAYDSATGEYSVVESTVNGTEITFKTSVGSESVHYAIVYTGAATSPSTGVPVAIFAAIIVVAVAGAAFAGKKAFAK